MTIVRNWIIPQIEPRTGIASNPPLITTTSLPNATAGVAYNFTMSAINGTPPYSWSITSDSPNTGNWLSIDPVQGTLSGTPTTAETETVLIRVTDSLNTPTSPTAFSLTVNPAQGNVWFGAALPTLPTQFSTTSSPPIPANTNRGSYYTPGVGGDVALSLQAAINAAAAATGTKGDVIVLQAGTLYSAGSGSFLMQPRSGQGWIYIMSSQAPELTGSPGLLPAAGTRIGRADIPNMPQLRSTGVNIPVISRSGSAGVTFYRWVGMDVELQNVQGTGGNFVIATGESHDTSLSTLCQHITYDRCYVAGSPANGSVEGIGLEGNFMEVTECRIERCFQTGNFDSHAIGITNSTGPYKINNNFMTSSGEITLTGGADTSLPSPSMPSDLTVTNNNYYKAFLGATISVVSGSTTITVTSTTGEITPALTILGSAHVPVQVGSVTGKILSQLTGKPGGIGTYQYSLAATGNSPPAGESALILAWLDKNTVEFKCGQRILFDSNFLECSGGSQQRDAFVVTTRNQNGTNPWYFSNDFTVTNNAFTNCFQGGMQWLLQDSSFSQNPTAASHRLLFRNNIMILSQAGNPNSSTNTSMGSITSNLPPAGQSGGAGGDLIWDHNTLVAPVTPNGMNTIFFFGATASGNNMQLNNVVFSNNIWDQSQYGIDRGGSPGTSTSGWANAVVPQCTQPVFTNNVAVNYSDATIPSGNFFPNSVAAVGYTNYGSTLQAQGYALTSGSQFHAKGTNGLGLPFNVAGPIDGKDIGANISTLPTLALQVTTPNLPDAQVGVAYGGVTLAAKGGTPPYTWVLTAASPNWLRVWGTEGSSIPGGTFAVGAVPQQVETDTIVFTVTDSLGANATATFTINVAHA